jgi:hypothetical protein
VQPTDEELFQKYNPELQKRSLERRFERQQEFDDFVTRLKEYSKSDKPSTSWIIRRNMHTANESLVWTVQAEAEKERAKQASAVEAVKLAEEVKARKEAVRREAGLPVESD